MVIAVFIMSFGVQNSTQKDNDKKKEKHGHHNKIQNKRQAANPHLLDLMLTSRKTIVISKPPRKF